MSKYGGSKKVSLFPSRVSVLREELRMIGSSVHVVIRGLDPACLVALPSLSRYSHPHGQSQYAGIGREIAVGGFPLELKNDPKVAYITCNNIPLI